MRRRSPILLVTTTDKDAMITIELTDEQRQILWDFTRPHTEAHVQAGIEPPCVRLEIELGGPYGNEACAVIGPARRGLGEVAVHVRQQGH